MNNEQLKILFVSFPVVTIARGNPLQAQFKLSNGFLLTAEDKLRYSLCQHKHNEN